MAGATPVPRWAECSQGFAGFAGFARFAGSGSQSSQVLEGSKDPNYSNLANPNLRTREPGEPGEPCRLFLSGVVMRMLAVVLAVGTVVLPQTPAVDEVR